MNQEELKYHKALQPLYERAMGQWQVGDRYYNYLDKEYDWVDKSDVYTFNHDASLRIYRIPLTIDPINPERGIVGNGKG